MNIFDVGTLETGHGVWNALYWLLSLAILFLIVYVLYSRGEKTVKTSKDQGRPFLAGSVTSKEKTHVRASNVYWGFTEALKAYYTSTRKGHTGTINDYVSWFILVLAFLFIVIGGL
jgi:hypothetical protein